MNGNGPGDPSPVDGARLVEALVEPVVVADRANRVLLTNAAARAELGADPVGARLDDLLGSGSRPGTLVIAGGPAAGSPVTVTAITGEDGVLIGTLVHLSGRAPARQPGAFTATAALVEQAVFLFGLDGRVLSWNPAAEQLLGYAAEEIVGKRADALVPQLCSAEAEANWRQVSGGERVAAALTARRHRDGRDVPVRLAAQPVHDEAGTVIGGVAVLDEAFSPVRLHREDLVDQLFAHSPIPQAVLTREGRHLAVNPALCELLGYGEDELAARTWQEITHPEDRAGGVEALERLFAGTVPRYERDKRILTATGAPLWVHASVGAIRTTDGTVSHVVAFFADATESKAAEDRLRHEKLHDPLTGLANRALLHDRLSRALQRAAQANGGVALLCVGIDRFGLLNHTLGNRAGDRILVEVGRRLDGLVRAEETVARLGGDVFALVVERRDVDAAEQTARDVLSSLREPIEGLGIPVSLTASVGLALGPPPGSSDELLLSAEHALRAAKSRGGGRLETFDSAHTAQARHSLELSTALRGAAERGELELHYQPIVDLATGGLDSCEALLRWNHPDHGLVPPGLFIPLAEDTGQILELGAWALHEATAATVRLSRQLGRPLRVAVNLSPRQLASPQVVQLTLAALAASGLPAAQLTLEVTESAVLDTDAAAATLAELHRIGVRLALDDFGTGYSSLLYLKQLPVDELKIDRTFVSGLGTGSDDDAIVASVIRLAAAIGVTVTAEGVETDQQLTRLRRLGAHRCQGHLFSPAVPEAHLHAVLERLTRTLRRPDQPAADRATLRRIHELQERGASLATIAAALNSERLPRAGGKRWTAAGVARVIAGQPPAPRRAPRPRLS